VPDLVVTVNGHLHTVSCDDGQEPRLRRLAQQVDARVGEFAAAVGQVGESRLLLLAALLLADQLSDAGEAVEGERTRHEMALSAVAETVDQLSARLEAIAARLETA
jgi:cell division protein ZapA